MCIRDSYLTYPSFEQFPDIVHCFSTRLGGVSQGIFSSMNLSFTRGDEENAVKDNYRRLSAAVGFSLEDIVTSDQTHTTNVQLVGAEDRGKGVTRPRTYKDVDGMITNVPGVVLCTFYADCVPLYFVDPVSYTHLTLPTNRECMLFEEITPTETKKSKQYRK